MMLTVSFTCGGSSKIHLRAIGFPETADGCFGDAAFARIRAGTAHLDDGFLIGGTQDASLYEAADAPVLHGYVACGSDEVGLLQTDLPLRHCVVGKSEKRPVQVGTLRASRNDLPDRDGVLDLLQHEGRED